MHKYTHYRGANYLIDIQRRELYIAGEKKEMRPRTFALLIQLVENQAKVLSKQDLLEKVWGDVTVEEQVLFQSIAEIRKSFAGQKVIHTHPRLGYSWVDPLEAQCCDTNFKAAHTNTGNNTSNNAPAANTNSLSKLKQQLMRLNSSRIYAALVACALFVAGLIFLFTSKQHINTNHSAMVFILPFENHVDEQGHRWFKLGGMDQLIYALNDKSRVFDASYVLETIKLTGLEPNKHRQNIAKLFKQSGAGLIVQAELSGSVKEYQLIYKLHRRDASMRGVIFATDTSEILQKLAQVVRRQTGIKTMASPVRMEFDQELVAEAVSAWQQGSQQQALSHMRAALELAKNKVRLRQLYAQWLLASGQAYEAEQQLKQAITESDRQALTTASSLHYWLAEAYFYQGKNKLFLSSLKTALASSAKQNDLLYSAYSYQLQGRAAAVAGEFKRAEHAFKQAKELHQSIHCPIGASIVELELAELWQRAGDQQQAEKHRQKAEDLITKNELAALQTRLEQLDLAPEFAH
ncbi:winged helix-turn-helix domain-containing protein [Agaribacterium haliotis]|uniref:winged helix-turn-helix domain-containing protein n=1 Tax=Agaribacterium haliotis TaxID=2013869 RepID=UPI000BB53EF1|nr:winged helix-turn-helix domain-containing protein [Agaribacterium haliotis]